MEQIDMRKIYEKLIEMEKRIINIELTVNVDAVADEDDREAIRKAREEYDAGTMLSLDEFKQKKIVRDKNF
jgi:hypothetical protein